MGTGPPVAAQVTGPDTPLQERLFFLNTSRKLLSRSSNQRLSDFLLKHFFKAKEKAKYTSLMRIRQWENHFQGVKISA